jgi:hypothetical protein
MQAAWRREMACINNNGRRNHQLRNENGNNQRKRHQQSESNIESEKA